MSDSAKVLLILRDRIIIVNSYKNLKGQSFSFGITFITKPTQKLVTFNMLVTQKEYSKKDFQSIKC